jgi:hypothetical protein
MESAVVHRDAVEDASGLSNPRPGYEITVRVRSGVEASSFHECKMFLYDESGDRTGSFSLSSLTLPLASEATQAFAAVRVGPSFHASAFHDHIADMRLHADRVFDNPAHPLFLRFACRANRDHASSRTHLRARATTSGSSHTLGWNAEARHLHQNNTSQAWTTQLCQPLLCTER